MSITPTSLGASGSAIKGNFVLVRADSLRLLLPQHEVGAAQYIGQELRATAQSGVFAHGEGDGQRRVVALGGRMQALPVFPGDRFVSTRLVDGERELSFAWNQVQIFIDAQFHLRPLPPAMRLPGAPIDGYAVLNDGLVFFTTAARVVAYAIAAGE